MLKTVVRLGSVLLGVILIGLMIITSADRIASTGTDAIRAILAVVFAFLVLFRRQAPPGTFVFSPFHTTSLVVAGLVLFGFGTVFDVNQCRWVGGLLMAFCCFRFGLPDAMVMNLPVACVVLYWAFPLPGQLMGPLVLMMQKASVVGAEWLSQTCGVAVWLDGIILRSGLKDFEVPEACSGMQTISAVLVCGLGTGLYLRLGWNRILVLMMAGALQVLALNVLRITFLVDASTRQDVHSSFNSLHDSAGAFLLAAIILIQVEAMLWSWRKRGAGPLRQESDAASFFGRMFHGVSAPRWVTIGGVLALLALLSGFISLLPRRPDVSRPELLSEVAYGLMTRQADAAEVLWRRIVELEPANVTYRLALFQTMLSRGKHQEVLDQLNAMRPDPATPDATLCRCWALMGLGRVNDARELLKSLPAKERQHPGIAIVAAEIAARSSDGARTVESIVHAAEWPSLAPRIRKLFPYLVSIGEWKTIAMSCQPSLAYDDKEQLLLALTACLQLNDQASAAVLLRQNGALCGNDTRFLSHYRFMAEQQPDWRSDYVRLLLKDLDFLSADELYDHLVALCRFHNGVVAPQLWGRLRDMDAQHPGLAYLGVILPDEWSALQPEAGTLSEWKPLPPAERLAVKASSLASAKASLEALNPTNRTYGMAMLYVDVLAQSDGPEPALVFLRKQMTRYPGRKLELNLREAWLLGAAERWQDAYEILRPFYNEYRTSPGLSSMMVTVLMKLDMGMYAMLVAEDAGKRFPENEEVKNVLSAVWESFDQADEALFVLGQDPPTKATPTVARLLSKMGRNREEQWVWSSLGDSGNQDARDRMWISPTAESVIRPAAWPALTGDELKRVIDDTRRKQRQDISPFLSALHDRMLQLYEKPDLVSGSGVDAWANVGRDPAEKAYALHQLAIVHTRQGREPEALASIDAALDLAPSSRVLWRMRVALSHGDIATIRKANGRCPDDSQLWLAEMVSFVSTEKPAEDVLLQRLHDAPGRRTFSTGTFIRLGDYLLRSGYVRVANGIVQQIRRTNMNLLPALALEVKVALALDEDKRALGAAMRLSDLSGDSHYEKLVVALMMSMAAPPHAVLPHVAALAEEYPNEAEWSIREAGLLLQAGDAEKAFALFDPVVQAHQSTLDPAIILLAAEAARASGKLPESIRILEAAWTRFPTNVYVLNNLVFVLAQTPGGVARAGQLLDELLKLQRSSTVYDTASVVYDRSGDTNRSLEYLELALDAAEGQSLERWAALTLSSAERLAAQGNVGRARELLTGLVEKVPGKKNEPRVLVLRDQLSGER